MIEKQKPAKSIYTMPFVIPSFESKSSIFEVETEEGVEFSKE